MSFIKSPGELTTRSKYTSRWIKAFARGGLLLSFLLLSCSPAVVLQAAEYANDPSCAEVTVRLPGAFGDQHPRKTTAQATAAWGDPLAVVLRCGIPMPPPSENRCIRINQVDWLIDENNGTGLPLTAVSYGRSPAVEVLIDPAKVSPTQVLTELSFSVAYLPVQKKCT